MAAARVCRHDVRCPHCGSNRMRKDGFAAGRQRYRCGAYRRPGAAVRERALRTYTEGSSLRAIGRIWITAPPAVLGRVKKGAPDPESAAGAEPAAHRGEGGPSADGSDCLG